MASANVTEEGDPTFDLRHCLLLNTGEFNIEETISFMNKHFEELTSRHGEDSKILILTGCHGTLDGSDALEKPALLDPGFFPSFCLALGTTHHEDDFDTNRINYQHVKPWTKQELFDLGMRRMDSKSRDVSQRLRRRLYKRGARVQVLNVANFVGASEHGGSENLVRTIQDCDPTAVVVNWCYSKDSFTTRLLTATGLFSKFALRNERILLTGNKNIQIDEDQSQFLSKAAKLIKKHYNRDTSERDIARPGLRFVLEGDPGTGKTLLALEVVRMLRSARGLCEADILVWIGDSRQQELRKIIADNGDLRGATYCYPGENALSQMQCLFDDLSERFRGNQHKILLVDEFQELHPTQSASRMGLIEKTSTTMDVVLCVKSIYWGVMGHHPDNMMSTRLRTPHRQGYQPLKFWQFFGMHNKRHCHPGPRSLVASELPESDPTLWIVLPEEDDLSDVDLICELVTEVVCNAEEKKILFCMRFGSEAEEKICNRYPNADWKFLDPDSIHGIETEVNVLDPVNTS